MTGSDYLANNSGIETKQQSQISTLDQAFNPSPNNMEHSFPKYNFKTVVQSKLPQIDMYLRRILWMIRRKIRNPGFS